MFKNKQEKQFKKIYDALKQMSLFNADNKMPTLT